eukprot:CAMPEP_0181331284 /NCGR_PEP_ID=MMETSP1101-20121128/24411_1 /TAXON_ID=46948 /ORGANISM="Rhodomonas abbreviata, Strain Caron Lab Isolate" /LENGTH=51 /DNA_ID=CAMNT_0023440717 /DNA_START=5 /DNA_END=160 /DNA_ORIENTATION=+
MALHARASFLSFIQAISAFCSSPQRGVPLAGVLSLFFNSEVMDSDFSKLLV